MRNIIPEIEAGKRMMGKDKILKFAELVHCPHWMLTSPLPYTMDELSQVGQLCQKLEEKAKRRNKVMGKAGLRGDRRF